MAFKLVPSGGRRLSQLEVLTSSSARIVHTSATTQKHTSAVAEVCIVFAAQRLKRVAINQARSSTATNVPERKHQISAQSNVLKGHRCSNRVDHPYKSC
jgi:hypothetical protein